MSTYDIVDAFAEIEDELISDIFQSIKRSLDKGKEPNISEWKEDQLKALELYRKNNPAIFRKKFADINERIEADIRKAYAKGSKQEQDKIIAMMQRGFRTAKRTSKYNRINQRKLNALIKAVKKDFLKAETAMLRKANDEYRKIIFNAVAGFNTGSYTLDKAIDVATKSFLSAGLTCVEYRNGHHVNIRSYSEMALRTANRRASIQGESSARDEYGINTVIVSGNSSPCPLCEGFVGEVFYDDVYSSCEIPKKRKYKLLSRAISEGLFHPNCTDTISTYYEGITKKPAKVTKKEKEKAQEMYKLTQQQRYNERNIRQYKRLAEHSVDEENKAKYGAKAKEWQARNRELIANHDELNRQYRREKN